MTIEFKATADYNAVVTELDKVRRQNERLLAQQGEMKQGADDNERAQVRAMRELERFAQQTGRSVQTVNERHQEQLGKLKEAFEANLLTAEQYGRAVEKANQDAANSYDVVAEKVDQIDDKQQQATSSTDALGGAVMKAVAGYLSFQAVLAKVGEALQWTREEVEKAKGTFEGMADPRRRLAQIADPTVAGRGLDELEARVDALAMQYGEDRTKVANALFSAVSEGFEEALPSLVKYGDIVGLEAAAGVAGQVPGLFKGAGLGAEEAVSTTLLAARQSRLSFEEIATAMPTIAEGAALAEASPTEAMGVLSVMAGTFKSGEQAAQRFKALATRFAISEDESLRGKGILGGVEALQAMPEEERREFLGSSQELNVAYQTLVTNLPAVRERIAELDAELATLRSGGEGTLERQYQEYFSGETDQGRRRLALEDKRQAEIQRQIANERQLAQGGLETQATRDRALAEMKEAGEATFGQFAVEKLGAAAELMGGGERGTATAMEFGRRFYGGTDTNLEFMGRAVTDVMSGGMAPVERIVTGEERMSSFMGPGAGVQAGMQLGQWMFPTAETEEQILTEQKRTNQLQEENNGLINRLVEALIGSPAPRSGTSTTTQPQMAAQTIPR